ncbi:hypothetical protein, partial [Citrobacter portucalensis]
QNDVTLKMPAFEWVHVQLHQQKGMISLSPPTICNSAAPSAKGDDKFITTDYLQQCHIKRLLLSPGNTSISPENIAGQSLSVGFRPFPQTTPNRKRS